MQFQIPQFIEVEDKIFGPLTFKQFIYLAGASGGSYLLFRLLPLLLALPLIALAAGLGGALAFLHWNGRPFIVALENGFYYLLRAKLYLWDNARKKIEAHAETSSGKAPGGELYVPKLSESKLHELAWSLDIKERVAGGYANDEDRDAGGGVLLPARASAA